MGINLEDLTQDEIDRVANLLENCARVVGQWVTWDAFCTWRDQHPTMTEREKDLVTLFAGAHMVHELEHDTVKYLDDEGKEVPRDNVHRLLPPADLGRDEPGAN